MILYKYTTIETGLRILSERKFRYTQPSRFNDPFELFPVITGNYTENKIDEILDSATQQQLVEKVYESTLKSGYENLTDTQKAFSSYEFYSKQMRALLEKQFEDSNLSLKKILKEKLEDPSMDFHGAITNEYLKMINNAIGILCLSNTNDDLLMWSHYCNSHNGVVLKINT